jgi:hypothetical protein
MTDWKNEIIHLEQLAQRQHRLSGVGHRSDQVFRTVSDTLIAPAKPVQSAPTIDHQPRSILFHQSSAGDGRNSGTSVAFTPFHRSPQG